MRLAQIARKLKVKTSEVVAFVDQKFEDQIVHAPNTKIPDDYVSDIVGHFTVETEVKSEVKNSTEPAPIKETKEEIQENLEVKIESQLPEEEDKIDAVNILDKKSEANHGLEEQESEEPNELIIEDGVIKAPKAEVKGIKVVGKIDLPTDKIEETGSNNEEDVIEKTEESALSGSTLSDEQIDTETDSQKLDKTTTDKKELEIPLKVEEDKKPAKKKKIEQPKKVSKNRKSLTYEEERNLAQKEYRDELKKQKAVEKKKKKANYDRMLKERSLKSTPKKPSIKKTLKETPDTATKKAVEKKNEPTTLWGKFILWLNT